MASCTLNWYPDRGFELDLDVENEEIAVRMAAVPIPVDGTVALRAGAIDLNRLEILFKAKVDIDGEPAQMQEATVQLVDDGADHLIALSARVEDVETGEILPFDAKVAATVASDAPDAGGPQPEPPDEDELDWEDETTLEQMIVNAPEATSREEADARRSTGGGGLQALLHALANLDDDLDPEAPADAELHEVPAPEPPADAPPEPEPEADPLAGLLRGVLGGANGPDAPDEPDADDQSISPIDEALGFAKLLLDRGDLELEEGSEAAELASGMVPILELPVSAESKAAALSAWLLDQDGVADLFIDDEDLAALLEQW